MKKLISQITLGFCYGACVVLLLRGSFIKPPTFSQGLAAVVAVLGVIRLKQNLPQLWLILGMAIGAILALFMPI